MLRYYRCISPACVRHNKSINGDFIDERFEELLRAITPREEVVQLTKAVLLDLWDAKVNGLQTHQATLEGRIKEINGKVETLLLRAARAMDDKLAQAYEEQILKLREESVLLQEKLFSVGV